MIEAQALRKTFRPKERGKKTLTAVRDVSFTARDGRITGLLGANGAGKSTSLRIIAALLEPDAGAAVVDGYNTVKKPLAVRRRIGYLPHNAGLYPRLTARENIRYFGELAGLPPARARQRSGELIELLGMQAFAERRAEGFSQGQRTKVALARALIHQPQNLVLDEPTNGLDVMSTRKLRQLLGRLRDAGHCVLISSHIMQEIARLCDHVAIINEGVVVMEDSVAGIRARTGQNDFEDAFVSAIGESLEPI